MVWLQVLLLSQASGADQVRVAVKVLPQLAVVTVSMTARATLVGSHASATAGVSNVHAALHSTKRLELQVIVGAVVSTTVMVWLQVLELHPEIGRASCRER